MSRSVCSAFTALSVSILALAATISLHAAETAAIRLTVQDLPPGTSEVIAVFDAGAAPAPDYKEAPPAAAADAGAAVAPQILPGAAPAGGARGVGGRGGRRRRFGGANAGVALPPPTRAVVSVKAATTATIIAEVPVAETYQARVIALNDNSTFPAVLAGGHVGELKLTAKAPTVLNVSVRAPQLKLAPDNPTMVKAGAPFTLAGTVSDSARSLGTKNRMRVWISEGRAPVTNYAGTQTSTIEVTTKGGDATFRFDLVAPTHATTLYYQFGEIPTDFASSDGRQAPFVVVPDLSAGAAPLSLRVE